MNWWDRDLSGRSERKPIPLAESRWFTTWNLPQVTLLVWTRKWTASLWQWATSVAIWSQRSRKFLMCMRIRLRALPRWERLLMSLSTIYLLKEKKSWKFASTWQNAWDLWKEELTTCSRSWKNLWLRSSQSCWNFQPASRTIPAVWPTESLSKDAVKVRKMSSSSTYAGVWASESSSTASCTTASRDILESSVTWPPTTTTSSAIAARLAAWRQKYRAEHSREN